jgi:transposase InsO family protein
MPPGQIVPKLADEGRHLASESTFCRKIVGWEVHESERAVHSSDLVQRTVWKNGCTGKTLLLHGDNGRPIKGQTVQVMLGKLGITASFSRPRVSDDNALVESLFRTCKNVPHFPKTGFASLEAARE